LKARDQFITRMASTLTDDKLVKPVAPMPGMGGVSFDRGMYPSAVAGGIK